MVDALLSEKLKKTGIVTEYKSEQGFPAFVNAHAGEKILILADRNTVKYARQLPFENTRLCFIDEDEPMLDERIRARAVEELKTCDYILAVGSGTLNDTAKYAAFCTGKQSGVLATAPSMDGYASPIVAMLKDGFKVSEVARVPSDILVDPAVLATAPREMIAAGVGDILGKYTCLTDWRLGQYHTGESVNEEAFSDMLCAVEKVAASVDDISRRGRH